MRSTALVVAAVQQLRNLSDCTNGLTAVKSDIHRRGVTPGTPHGHSPTPVTCKNGKAKLHETPLRRIPMTSTECIGTFSRLMWTRRRCLTALLPGFGCRLASGKELLDFRIGFRRFRISTMPEVIFVTENMSCSADQFAFQEDNQSVLWKKFVQPARASDLELFSFHS